MTVLFVTILETLSCRTRWHRMCNWYQYVKVNVFYTTMTLLKIFVYFMTREFFTQQSGINKQNNYHNAYTSLLIGCRCRCAKTILRCKSVVCTNQLRAKLHFDSKMTSCVENMNFGPRFSIRNTEKFGCFNSVQRVIFKLK